MRLPRSRKGKTPLDVQIIEQNDTVRLRITLGEDLSARKRNTDMDEQEITDLIAMLNYHLLVIRGEIDE